MSDAIASRVASFSEYRRVLLALLMQPRLWQQPLYRAAALRQFNLIMAQSLTSLGLRAFILGFLLVAYVLVVVSADVQVAFKIFHIALFREGGPLITAILLLLSQGTDTTSVLQTQRDRGELAWLHNMGLPWPHLLVLPAPAGIDARLCRAHRLLPALLVARGVAGECTARPSRSI